MFQAQKDSIFITLILIIGIHKDRFFLLEFLEKLVVAFRNIPFLKILLGDRVCVEWAGNASSRYTYKRPLIVDLQLAFTSSWFNLFLCIIADFYSGITLQFFLFT